MTTSNKHRILKRCLASLILFLWITSCGYIGIGGLIVADLTIQKSEARKEAEDQPVIINGTSFRSEKLAAIDVDFTTLYEKFYPWMEFFPESLSLILTACSFGALGSTINLVYNFVKNNGNVEDIKYISIPLLGFLTGIVIIGISYLLPTILVTGETKIRPTSLLFLGLFGGFYLERFYEKLSSKFDQFFK